VANHHETFFASDALSTAIDAHTHKPDLIILDLGLPAVPTSEYTLPLPQPGGGFLVMERLAADTDLAPIPVIIVSGLDPYANRERALRGGGHGFCAKAVGSG